LTVDRWRTGGHHDVLHVSGKARFTLTVSQSPASIDQAIQHLRRELDMNIRRNHGS
jgi:hypothetical protein